MVNYALEGPKWGSAGRGTAGGTVTWAVDGTIPASFLGDIGAAFADWSKYANISFQQVATTAAAKIDFSLGFIDGFSNVLAEATYYYSGSALVSAAIEFDIGEGWHGPNGAVSSNSGADFFLVALHEIGHAIGLDHYNAGPAVMNSYLNPALTDLTASDIDGIQALYGKAAAAQAPAPPPPPAPDVFVGQSSNFARGPFDAEFYLLRSPDVAEFARARGLDGFAFAESHFQQFGWREGRNPNSFFDVTDYLDRYTDVKAAGIDPLAHYHQNGWREGRDPSGAFDTKQYLSHYTDVAAAHIDPLQHYLKHGIHEGRLPYGDGLLM